MMSKCPSSAKLVPGGHAGVMVSSSAAERVGLEIGHLLHRGETAVTAPPIETRPTS